MFMICDSIQRCMVALNNQDGRPRVADSLFRCNQLDEGRKWTGTCSLCRLPRNEHSDSWELISSVQVRTIDGSNAEANKLHLTVDCNAVGWVLLFPTLLRL